MKCIYSLMAIAFLLVPVKQADAVLWNKILVSYNTQVFTLWDVYREFQLARVNSDVSIESSISKEELKSFTKKLVVEYLVTEEAESFKIGEISEEDQRDAFTKFKGRFQNKGAFDHFMQRYSWTEMELKQSLIRPLKADKFIKEKILSAYVFLSTEEIEEYHKKYPHFTLEEAKDQLKKKRIQENLRDWIESLKIRYEITSLWD